MVRSEEGRSEAGSWEGASTAVEAVEEGRASADRPSREMRDLPTARKRCVAMRNG